MENVFTTAEANRAVYARVRDNDIVGRFADTLEARSVDDFEVMRLSGADRSPDLGETGFALTCAQCGTTVDSEGTAARLTAIPVPLPVV